MKIRFNGYDWKDLLGRKYDDADITCYGTLNSGKLHEEDWI